MEKIGIFLEIIGGFSLILYGIHLSGINLQKIFGSKLEDVIKKASNNPVKGLAVGAAITSAIHSSSTTTMILIGLITGGFMDLYGAVPIMLGANIGSTLATQLASLRIGNCALLFLALGVIIHISAERKLHKRIGEAVIGFSFLFLGMDFLFSAINTLSYDRTFTNVINALTLSPERALCAGALATMLLRSASAASILTVALAATSVISLPTALFVILGVNLGSSLKAIYFTLKGKNFSGKLALIHFIFNIIGIAFFITIFPYFCDLAKATSSDSGRQVANAYTLYNLVTAILFLPLAPYAVEAAKKMSPSIKTIKKASLFYLDRKLICTPSVSLQQANRGTIEMAKIAQEMTESCRSILFENNIGIFPQIEKQEKKIDSMTEKISEYLIQVSQQNLDREDTMKLYSLMHIVADMEHLCDHIFAISKIFVKLQNNKYACFSDKAKSELLAIYGKLRIMENLVIKSLEEENVKLANEITLHENKIDEIIKKIHSNHAKRLEEGVCSQESDRYFCETLNGFERIGDHYDNIAYAIIDRYCHEDRK